MSLRLSSPVTELPRVGEAKAKCLGKLNIKYVRDFLYTFPRRYDDFSNITSIDKLRVGEKMTVRAKVKKVKSDYGWRGRRRLLRIFVDLEDETGVLGVTWYNLKFLPRQLWVGREILVAGVVEEDPRYRGGVGGDVDSPVPTSPSLPAGRQGYAGHGKPGNDRVGKSGADGDVVDSPVKPGNDRVGKPGRGADDKAYFGYRMRSPVIEFGEKDGETTHTGRIIPVYPETYGVTSRFIRYQVRNLLPLLERVPEYLPKEIIERNGLMGIHEAVKEAHFPSGKEKLEAAEKRLRFDELFFLQLAALVRRKRHEEEKALAVNVGEKELKNVADDLPFELTGAQRRAIDEVAGDMKKSSPMNRLLQGDVGSGKSAVALAAVKMVLRAGYKVFYLAPTDILARQQADSFSRYLGEGELGLLTGASKKKEREEVAGVLASDKPYCLVGTHALLYNDLEVEGLALAIVDEQHRFGVGQRRTLIKRGCTRIKRGSDADITRINADKTRIDADRGKLLYEDLSYELRGAVYEVANNLGLGLKESVYHKALEEELNKRGIEYDTERKIEVEYNGKRVGFFKPDLVVDGKIVVELKALSFVGNNEKRQLWTYLKGSEYKLGLLVNFGNKAVEVKRVVYDTARGEEESAFYPRESALMPHLLSMTATPIPRTLNLTVYGDLDVSVLDEMPPGRQPIETKVVGSARKEKAILHVLEELHAGRQAYVIAPLVEKSEKLQVKSARETLEEMRHYFPDVAVELVHGRMSAEEKKSVMNNFNAGAIQMLVSTAVVEVGVDVPNATCMIIEGAERFGLAQLHQFRGRIGRGEHKSYCYLFPSSDEQVGNERLQTLCRTGDGFKIAEADLRLRGPGEVYGTAQSGYSDLQVASLLDYGTIKLARSEAENILEQDSELEGYDILRRKVEQKNMTAHFE